MDLKERIINALYGCAVADAVGNPFEFKKKINPDDVVKYANDAKKLVISDDTQMTMFGFEAIDNYKEFGGILDEELVRFLFTDSYLDWYNTQIIYSSVDNDFFCKERCLEDFQSMFSVQAPGATCLNSLYAILNNKQVVNDSMGCGSVMRLLPLVSLYTNDRFRLSPHEVMTFAKISGNITHKHKDNDIAISTYMNCARDILFNNLSRPIQSRAAEHISEIGDGWIAPECVDMAIWAYTKANTFDELLSLSISHDGDSDSVAAVAGSLWGLSGREVPQTYIDKLDAGDAIKYVVDNYIK